MRRRLLVRPLGRQLRLWHQRRPQSARNRFFNSTGILPARRSLAEVCPTRRRQFWRIAQNLLRRILQGTGCQHPFTNRLGLDRFAGWVKYQRPRNHPRGFLFGRQSERRRFLERARLHRHRFPVRLLSEISPLSQFLPGIRVVALPQSGPQSRRILRLEVPAQRIPAALRILARMILFPPRLLWGLARVRIAQKLFGASRYPWALRLDLAQLRAQTEVTPPNGADSCAEVSSRDSQALSQVRASSAPVVWIGGDTPLQHARIGHLARDIVNCARTVFVEMDGTLLRRRIHEFRPVSRLYLVLPLNGLEDAHDSRFQHTGNFRATMESLCTAKLSGFHICIETTIFPGSERSELLQLANFISTLDVDGWIHKRPVAAANDEAATVMLQSAREIIQSRQWRTFSALLDSTPASAQPSFEKKRGAIPTVQKVEKLPTREPHEEGLRAL